MTLTLAQRQFYNRVEGRYCDCGAPAVIKGSGYFICEKCRRLQQANTARELRAARAGAKEAGAGKGTVAWLWDDARHALWNFRSSVREEGSALVVSGHGTYRLPI